MPIKEMVKEGERLGGEERLKKQGVKRKASFEGNNIHKRNKQEEEEGKE